MTEQFIKSVAVMLLLCLGSSQSFGASTIPWDDDLVVAFQQSAQTGKPILLHFYSNNCPPCKMLDTRAFKDEKVIGALSGQTIPLKINVDKHRDLADRYEVTRWPTDVYLHPNGDEIGRSVSPQDPDKYCALVNRVESINRGWITERIASQKPMAGPVNTAGNIAGNAAAKGAPIVAAKEAVYSKTPTQDNAAYRQSALASRSNAGSFNESAPIVASSSLSGRPVVSQSTTFGNPSQLVSGSTEVNPYCATTAGPDGQTATQVSSGADQVELGNQAVTSTQFSTAQWRSNSKGLVEPVDESHDLANASPFQTVGHSADAPANRYAQATARLGGVMSEDLTPVLDGCCPVSLRTQNGWIVGSPSFAVKHRGRIYHCLSEEARQQFLAKPDFYSPILSGYDIVHFCETGKLEAGKREFGCESGGHIFLFKDAQTYEVFRAQALQYLQQISSPASTERVAQIIEGDSVRR